MLEARIARDGMLEVVGAQHPPLYPHEWTLVLSDEDVELLLSGDRPCRERVRPAYAYLRPRRRVTCLMITRRIVGFLRSRIMLRRTLWLPSSFIMVLAFSGGPPSLRGHSSGGLLQLNRSFLYMVALPRDYHPHCNAR